MSDDLLALGGGNGSVNERIKLASAHLRGTIAQQLRSETSTFGEEDVQLLKFHGSYQQDDRDRRRERKAAGLEKAHQFMVRSRIPGGALTADQYLVQDAIAGRYGGGTLRLTTRQGIQLHGVLKGNLRAAIASISGSLLSTLAACGDVNRNVMACPAPACDRASERVQGYARRIAMHLAPRTAAYHEIWLDGEKLETPGDRDGEDVEPIYGRTYLPRKFKIGIALPQDNCVDVYSQDIGLIPEFDGGELRGFTAVVGGGMGSTHGKVETYPRLATPLCFVPPDDVVAIVEAIVTIQRDYGDRANRRHARMKYLVQERGIGWFRQELEVRFGRRVSDPRQIEFGDVPDHLGWRQQRDGNWFLGLYVENGRIVDRVSSLLRTALREVVAAFRPELRITAQQNLLLTGIAEGQHAAVEAVLREHGVETDPAALGLRRNAMACPALPTCGLAVAEAERALPAIVADVERALSALGLDGESVGIRMTGCPNGCARPRMGEIGIVGRSLGIYDVYVGGDRPNTRLNAVLASGVAQNDLAATLAGAFAVWKRRRHAGEAFGDFADRYGVERLRESALPAAAGRL